MSKFIVPMAVLCLIFSIEGCSQTATTASKSNKIDITHIALTLSFDWQKKQASGYAEISLAMINSSNKIFLDAGNLTIQSISLRNGSSLFFNYDGGDKKDGLEISLDRTYHEQEQLTVKISYHTNWINESDPNNIGGSFGKGLRFFQPTPSNPIKRKQVWSSGEPESNRYWFPCKEAIDDLRTTEFSTTIDEKLTAISNGILVEAKQNSNGTKTFHYTTDKPYPNYLTSLVIGEYVAIQQMDHNIRLQTFCYPDEKYAAEATIARLPDMLSFFSRTTGVDYPFSIYSQVVVQGYPFPSQVGQHMVSTVSDNMIDDYGTHADFLYLWDGVESNALASQWFGNLISVKDWNHIWLVKSFAQYLEGLYTAYKNGHDEYLLWYHPFESGSVSGDWNAGYKHPLVTQQIENVESFVGDNYAKFRGSLVLRLLQKQLGDEKWWKVLRYFVKQNAFKQVSTADLQKSIETATGENLDWFFEQWVYKVGLPFFDVVKTYNASAKQLQLTLRQIQKPDTSTAYPQVEFFQGKMEIEIDDRIETVWIEAKPENRYSFNIAHNPKLVQVDFERSWIKEMQFERTFEELLYQFQNDKDVLGRSSAMTELVAIAKNEKTTGADKIKIQEAFQKVIQGTSYWRFKSTVIGQLNNLFPKTIDEATAKILQRIIKNEKTLLRASAIGALGTTNDPKFADIYISYLKDSSDRVVFSAANALGKTKSPKAFDALVKLKKKPSWKNQSLMSALTGLRQLGDLRGVDIALDALKDNTSPRWFLGNFWDYPFIAAQTLAALGKGEAGYPIVLERFKQSMQGDDVNDIFQHVLLLTTLGDPRAAGIFQSLRTKFKDDANAMAAVGMYEEQFKTTVKK